MDELHANMANNSCVDMYKFATYAAEIERRENLQSVAGVSGNIPPSLRSEFRVQVSGDRPSFGL